MKKSLSQIYIKKFLALEVKIFNNIKILTFGVLRLIFFLFFTLFFLFPGNTTFALTSVNTSTAADVRSGLVGWWTFDGKNMTNATATDMSGNNAHGRLTNMTATSSKSAGKVGQALTFDGVNDYIEVGQGKYSFTKTTPFSGSAWVKISSTSSQMIMSNYQYLSDPGWHLFVSPAYARGKVVFGLTDAISSGRFVYGSTTVTDGLWHHVSFSYDGSNTAGGIKLYVDGRAEALTVYLDTDPGSLYDASFMIGSVYGSTFYLKGAIDDVRLYNRTITPLEVQSLYKAGGGTVTNTSPGKTSSGNNAVGISGDLVGHWTFDGKNMTNATATDMSGNGYHGTLTNMTTASSKVMGKIGQALTFDGVNDNIIITGSPNVQNISYWIKPSNDKYSVALSGAKAYVLNNGLYSGAATSTRYVNGVIPTSESLGSELITDGTAESGGTVNWNSYFEAANSAAGSEGVTSSSPYAGTYSFDITITNAGTGNSNDVQFGSVVNPFSVTSGVLYKVQFAVKGSASFTGASVNVMQDGSPYTSASLNYGYNITTGWVLHTFYFYSERTGTSDNKINFRFGNSNTGHVYFDNISVKRVNSVGDVTSNKWNFVSVNLNTPVTSDSINIGNIGSRYLSGAIDDVRLYSRTLSSAEIQSLYKVGDGSVAAASPTNNNRTGINSGLVGHWTFDGKNMTSTTALDSSGNNRTGTLTNMTQATSKAIGKLGQGLNFDGTNDYVSIPYTGIDYERTQAITISAWVKLNNVVPAGGYQTIFGRMSGSTQGMTISWCKNAVTNQCASNSYGFALTGGPSNNFILLSTSASTGSPGKWAHVVVTYSGNSLASGVKMYVNGVSLPLTVYSNTLSSTVTSTTNWRIGDDGTTDYSSGIIDDVRFYNRELTAAEVKKLYKLGTQ